MNTTKYRTYNPRNAKNVDKYSVGVTNNIDYAGDGIAMIQDSGSSAVCALNSATDGFLMLEFQKILQATG